MERDSFIFYKSFYEAIKDLPDNIRLEVYTAITEYGLYGKHPEGLKPIARGLFTLIKPNIDVNNKRFENGQKGGRRPAPRQNDNKIGKPSDLPSSGAKSFDDEIAVLAGSKSWIEATAMKFRLTPEELSSRLDAFALHCNVERPHTPHSSIEDARQHFLSWMRKAYLENKNNTVTTVDPPADYSFNGGFGSMDS